ncbi:hypothetical protein BDD21_0313 [Thiocapsa rosea]|uniref:Uncharacterized protein n=1 Tax=Thiocapsa rosea TaxID=69360 RepID=A0A495V0T8_9GAMM|nr:hypothetical protein BDD21_0313 [Thiocapsa rosea]
MVRALPTLLAEAGYDCFLCWTGMDAPRRRAGC